MKTFVLSSFVLAIATTTAAAKPPVAAKATPTPVVSQAPAVATSGSFLHWLMEQDGGTSAVGISMSDLLAETTGQAAAEIKPADPTDTAVLAKLSSALDGLLPKLNRPDSAVRLAKRLAVIPALVDDELQTALSSLPGLECTSLANADPSSLGNAAFAVYPSFRVTDQASRRTYYLGVTFIPTGQAESPASVLQIDPKLAAAQMTQPGACLLVSLEHNNKPSNQLAFLNWQILELQKAKIRARVSFGGIANEVLLPAAALNDGRRGRD